METDLEKKERETQIIYVSLSWLEQKSKSITSYSSYAPFRLQI